MCDLKVEKGKEEGEKAGLKLNIHKTKIMASGPITSWQIDGETVETEADFICISLPLGLALGSPIFPSGCEGKLGVALESLQGLRDLT